MKKTLFIFTVLSYFFIFAAYSNENTSIKSGKKGECKIFIKQKDNDVFQEVKCTSELKYPEPIYGYDVKHCISFKTYRYARSFGKTNGLYCSMNGYDQKSKWYYVK
tara:strand:- start:1064 stop:1381 length:318 start_codon:yes stop_codon:yes gene_type:complete